MKFPTKSLCSLFVFLLLSHGGTSALYAAPTVAIVDSGVDFRHKDLEKYQFFNPSEVLNGRDTDNNGYEDDRSGWNFVTMSPQTFDANSFPFFEEDFYRYYEVRRKRSLKISNEAEDAWYDEKRKDEAFQEKRKLFRRYVHGTHVAGLATGLGLKQILKSKNLPSSFSAPDIMAITYLGDTEKGPAALPEFEPLSKGDQSKKLKHLKSFMRRYLSWQKNKLNLASSYANQFAHIMNASFGISHKNAGKMVKDWWDAQFPEEEETPQEEVLKAFQDEFRAGLITLTKEVVDLYPRVLFIFSAGNTKDNTSIESHYPSGVACDHCLTVGASLGTKERAYFSNFGETSVSLFAPGIAVQSSVPEDRELPVNGTSQAAPQVAFAAANILKTAWKEGLYINSTMVKEILMNSVDIKDFLKTDCVSSGILNPLRAIRLTKHLKKYSLKTARIKSYKEIKDLDFLPEGATYPLETSPLVGPKKVSPTGADDNTDELFTIVE